VVAELEMAEDEDMVVAFSKGDGRLRVDGDEVFMLLELPAGPDDDVGLEDEEGATGCAIGT
jgi:hypothetical protein